jgi:hypothetical protein
MGKNGKTRRQRRGQAWHWKQMDCWYYTPPATKRRARLFDMDGRQIRGKENRKAADMVSIAAASLVESSRSIVSIFPASCRQLADSIRSAQAALIAARHRCE